MRSRLRRDLSAAIKARDSVAVSALRTALAAIENAEAVDVISAPPITGNEHFAGATSGHGAAVQRRALTNADEAALVQSQVDQRSMAAQEFEALGRQDVADLLRAEADVLRAYLATSP